MPLVEIHMLAMDGGCLKKPQEMHKVYCSLRYLCTTIAALAIYIGLCEYVLRLHNARFSRIGLD